MERRDLYWVAAFVVVLGLPIVLWLYSHGGIEITAYAPGDLADPQTRIEIAFNEPMAKESVQARFNLVPQVAGEFDWPASDRLVFQPDEPLLAGQSYRVQIDSGAQSRDGDQALKQDWSFDFKVRLPSIIFLGPASEAFTNLFTLDLETGELRQLTHIETGVQEDYALSPDGQWVAYSVRRKGRAADIWALNLISNQTVQMTNCVDAGASCGTPAWRPDGSQIAYTRRELDDSLGWEYTEHVWVVDVETRESTLLFDDPEFLARYPQWSPNGERIAMVVVNPSGILVYDLLADESVFVSSQQGLVGTFAPDSNALLYPILRTGPVVSNVYTHLRLADFAAFDEPVQREISGPPETPVEDLQAAFHPDGTMIALNRRYLDDRYTTGGQVYILDLETEDLQELVYDPVYIHGAMSWSPDGNMLLMQRHNLEKGDYEIELWLYTLSTGEFRMIHDDGFQPQFLP